MLSLLEPSGHHHSRVERQTASRQGSRPSARFAGLSLLSSMKGCGVIPLADVTLVEDLSADPQHILASVTEEDSADDTNSNMTDSKTGEIDVSYSRLFRLIVESRDQTAYSATFVANDEKHKSEWCADIAQCLQNLRYTELVTRTFRNESSVMSPESVKCANDPTAFIRSSLLGCS